MGIEQNFEKDSAVNTRGLADEIGRYTLLLPMLLNLPRENQPIVDGRINMEVVDYATAKKSVPSLIAQMYRLELMFPPEVAFLGGLNGGNKLELIEDLDGKDSFTNVAIVDFPHNDLTDRISKNVLGEIPEKLRFAIGYAQGTREKNLKMKNLGFNNYICSVITDHNFRQVSGIGSRMVAPILESIDKEGKSYLTTWVDTGSQKQKVSLSHYPGVGFWFNQHYDLLSIDQSKDLLQLVKEKHESSGITGRKYDLKEVQVSEINRKLYGDNFSRRLGPKFSDAYNFIETRKEPFSVIPDHYENGWTGIIMTRDPQIVAEKRNNPRLYGELIK